MSLYVTISINAKAIRTFGAQRITKNPTGENTYRVCKYVDNGDKTANRVYLPGVIYHNREEGAVILSKKVIDFAISMGEL